MSDLERISITLPKDLAKAFTASCEQKGYSNRSEAIRDLIRGALVKEEWQDPAAQVAASLTMIYDHHTRQLNEKLTELQHDHEDLIVSTLHVHLNHDKCLEVIVLRGEAQKVQDLSDKLRTFKGVKYAQVCFATDGSDLG